MPCGDKSWPKFLYQHVYCICHTRYAPGQHLHNMCATCVGMCVLTKIYTSAWSAFATYITLSSISRILCGTFELFLIGVRMLTRSHTPFHVFCSAGVCILTKTCIIACCGRCFCYTHNMHCVQDPQILCNTSAFCLAEMCILTKTYTSAHKLYTV